jgi:predicted nucleic acid-binding protein
MIVLDTNVLSELIRPSPSPAVIQWVSDQPPASVFLSAITEAELRYGLALLPTGKRRSDLAVAIEGMLRVEFEGRILPFDSDAAIAFALIAAARRQSGRPISQADAQIAAVAQSRGAALASRNVGDFSDCGIEVINPWAAAVS